MGYNITFFVYLTHSGIQLLLFPDFKMQSPKNAIYLEKEQFYSFLAITNESKCDPEKRVQVEYTDAGA